MSEDLLLIWAFTNTGYCRVFHLLCMYVASGMMCISETRNYTSLNYTIDKAHMETNIGCDGNASQLMWGMVIIMSRQQKKDLPHCAVEGLYTSCIFTFSHPFLPLFSTLQMTFRPAFALAEELNGQLCRFWALYTNSEFTWILDNVCKEVVSEASSTSFKFYRSEQTRKKIKRSVLFFIHCLLMLQRQLYASETIVSGLSACARPVDQ